MLDGCDGELARIKFQESRWGRVLDFWGDNAVHFALFACMGIGLYPEDPRSIVLGTLACLSALGSAWLSFRLHQKTAAGSGPLIGAAPLPAAGASVDSVLQRVEALLAQRDFIYLLLAATAAQRSIWFLWAAGIGSPLYLSVLLYLCLQTGQRAAPPPTRRRPRPGDAILIEREGACI